MLTILLEPFSYGYMTNAIWVSGLVAALCAFLSAYLMLKGWSLIGDALSHAIVPGVAVAALAGLPFALGAFIAGGLASASMQFLGQRTKLKQDAVIGLIFTGFFGFGLFLISLNPQSVNVQTIIMGNVLAISPFDRAQVLVIALVSALVLAVIWKDLMVVFFDELHARSIGLNPTLYKTIFFTLLSAAVVAALQAVGAFLIIALVVTPGATAYLLSDHFPRLLIISTLIGLLSALFGAYISYFLDGATGGVIVLVQTGLFLLAFLFAPKHGLLARKRRARRRRGHAPEVTEP